MVPTTKAQPDWERIEMQYRAGTVSVRELAAEHGVSHTAINKRAKQKEWGRDLQARIKAKADAKVSKALVSSEVSIEALATESLLVEVEAAVQARIRIAHRSDIGRYRALGVKLLHELEAQTDQVSELYDLGELLSSPDERGLDKLNEIYQRIISLPTRTKTMKDSVETLRVLIALEREAFGIDADKEPSATGYEELLAKVLGRV